MVILTEIRWYYNRLKSMSFAEIIWRLNSELSGIFALVKVNLGLIPMFSASIQAWLSISRIETGFWQNITDSQLLAWKRSLLDQADRIIDHKLSFFNLHDVDLGHPINWHLDRNSGLEAPLKNIFFVNYRESAKFGDCKLVWEPNRHHQLVVLGRAYKATGEAKYAREVILQIEAWIEANPYGFGMNWRSPLELSIRVINWVWALDLISDAGVITNTNRRDIVNVAFQHCHDVQKKYSRGTSANNHLVGEAAGVFVASRYFGFSKSWIDESQSILETEIRAQSYPDGCTREQAIGYQYFVLQFYLACGIVADRSGIPFGKGYWDTFSSMLVFMLELGSGGNVPLFGDCDDGYLLDMGSNDDRLSVLSWMNRLIDGNARYDSLAKESCEARVWLECKNVNRNLSGEDGHLESIAFPDSGYYLLQSNSGEGTPSIVFDCGELGYTSIAAHGHADALSFVFRLWGMEFLVDTGTYDYFSYPEWRQYFRSTRAHNTIEVDGKDQSSMVGPFMWEQHAQAKCTSWRANVNGGKIVAEHDGYLRLDDPVLHERSLDLTGSESQLTIVDQIECSKSHEVKLYFHFAPGCRLTILEENALLIEVADHRVIMKPDHKLQSEIIRGTDAGPVGWYSTGYHSKTEISTLVLSAKIRSPVCFTTVIAWT